MTMNPTLNQTPVENDAAPLLQDYHRNPQTEENLADDPAKTVMLLLQGVVDKGNLAKLCHTSEAYVEKGFHLGRMTTILDALRDRLALTKETPLAYDLDELYRYADKAIQEAVYEKESFYLDSALEILTEIRDAWLEMMHSSGQMDDND
ncbi:flagellar protein FliS [Thiomicrospira sp. WB1]|uniref:flagellar export chaperone FliS n=1 Tax=Thiomicrospira sp. WB1 TaxID=1685380 RepID=UPI0007485FA0|nr:flagellar protein FliS [Thiomicrospira sp. WB1]KUJ72420.1 flagellar protein FliS [Thiomicrospira sp. WB1]